MEYRLKLDARDTQPLARAMTLARGDQGAARVRLWFCDGEQALGGGDGDYATLSLRRLGTEESADYLMARGEDGDFVLEMLPAMTAEAGLYMATAVLYDQAKMRLTTGRFCFAVRDDLNLPQDGALSQAQVALVQQALGAVALMQDACENLSGAAKAAGDYAQEQGEFARQWGEAARDVVNEGGATVTWDTLAGRPASFPPAAHSHDALDTASVGATGSTLVKRDFYGRIQAAEPAAESDVARRAECLQLETQIAGKAGAAVTFSVQLPQAGWANAAGGGCAQTVAHASADAGRVALAGPVLPEDAQAAEAVRKAYAQVQRVTVEAGAVTVRAAQHPGCDLTLRLSLLG